MKQSAELDEEMKVIDDLYQEKVNQTIDFEDSDKLPLVLMNEDNVMIDHSNYNIPLKENSDTDSLCLQRLQIMSIEQNELKANIHFNHLMKAKWSPDFDVCFENNKFYSYYLFNKYNFLLKNNHY